MDVDLSDLDSCKMYFKENRLKTFINWPFEDGDCNAERLADAGFCHIPSDQSPDATRCFACYKELDGWEPEDDPWSEHKKHSPACPFLRLGIPVEQLTVQEVMRLESKRRICFVKKVLDAKAKELQEQSLTVRAIMESFLDKC